MFNRKSTENSQLLHSLTLSVNALKTELEEEKASNRRNLLEYAELGDKMRHLYQRIARRQKIESEETSTTEEAAPDNGRGASAQEIRRSIENSFGAS